MSIDVQGILEHAGADLLAPEGSQGWSLAQVAQSHARLLSALHELEDLFDGQEDCDDGVPNDAMRAMTIIHFALAKAGAP
jgi:hypothetical protein